MTLIIILKYLLVGSVVGLLSGSFGIGGGIILMPILLLYYPFSQAVEISLGVMLITSAINITFRNFMDKANLYEWLRKILPGIILGIVIGLLIHVFLKPKHLHFLLNFILGGVGLSILLRLKFSFIKLPNALYALFFGILSSCFGIGVGTLSMPYLLNKGVLVKQAIDIIVICTFFSTLTVLIGFGFTQNFASIDWAAMVTIALASSVVAVFASRVSKKINQECLKNLFALVLISLAIFTW